MFAIIPSCNVINYKLTIYPIHLIPFYLHCSTEAILALTNDDFTFKGGGGKLIKKS